ncbi:MAG: 50S ribosomal protein L21 [Bacteroidetes bacterium]|nr:MAG: 50S ribosomal protein L21 [Bacteroidota bacterium]
MAYAIVNIAGQQFKVTEGQKLYVHRLEAEEGDKVTFEEVLLVAKSDDQPQIGKPVVKGAKVTATVLGHQKGDKVLVFKKKRRKGYKVKKGHRQHFTHIQIEGIKA